jgi:hypothetical protein
MPFGSGGGASAPLTLTGNGAIAPPLSIHNSDPSGSQAFHIENSEGTGVFDVDTSDAASAGSIVDCAAPFNVGLSAAYAGFNIARFNGSGGATVRISDDGRMRASGAVTTARHSAPADGEMDNGECALWLDQTPGATKLMVKAKDSGGTVRTASVNLA